MAQSWSTVKRLTTDEKDILLEALDDFAIREDPDRSAVEDEAAADLANALLGDGSGDVVVKEIIILYEDQPVSLPNHPASSEELADDEGDEEVSADLDDEEEIRV